jgi:hypothetical protein
MQFPRFAVAARGAIVTAKVGKAAIQDMAIRRVARRRDDEMSRMEANMPLGQSGSGRGSTFRLNVRGARPMIRV